MIGKISLRFGINTGIALLVTVAVLGGAMMVWYTYRIDGIIDNMANRTANSYKAATALENTLLNQKGFLSYYLMDGDAKWLRLLDESRVVFLEKLSHAEALAEGEEENKVLGLIRKRFGLYVADKAHVLQLYKEGKPDDGQKNHQSVRQKFSEIMALCIRYKTMEMERLTELRNVSLKNSGWLRKAAYASAAIEVVAGLMIAFLLFDRIISPLKDLVAETDRESKNSEIKNEIKKLAGNIHNLLVESGKTSSELEKSRENLVMSEKLAMVGKLAAGMAHSVRNPLTSVKMRLFSLTKSSALSKNQTEDLQVISDEVQHIETIVQNFLEFSRPPKLKMQLVSPSEVVERVMRLLLHRLNSYNVQVQVIKEEDLPEIEGDPEQLKEVFVNLLENACEAMGNGGQILVREFVEEDELAGRHAVVSIKDSGPGIPDSVCRKIFQPFFTTRENGTGLGLSIARRIVKNHGGWIGLSSKEGHGAEFSVHFPVKE